MSSEIRAQMEELDEIVSSFSSKLGEYVRMMGGKTNEVSQIVASLRSSWSGPSYEAFQRKMSAETEKMDDALRRGEELKKELDLISKQFADALATLRASGE